MPPRNMSPQNVWIVGCFLLVWLADLAGRAAVDGVLAKDNSIFLVRPRERPFSFSVSLFPFRSLLFTFRVYALVSEFPTSYTHRLGSAMRPNFSGASMIGKEWTNGGKGKRLIFTMGTEETK